MIQSRSAGQAKGYFNDSLRQSDYYLDEQEHQGYFNGKVAARLGVTGSASKTVFDALCENIHPLTGQSLTPRNVANRTVGYDINFHCPKSVSVLHALTIDSHILDAFQASVQDTMLDIESDAKTRIRKQGQDSNRDTRELIWAEFLHQTARPVGDTLPDPHLHCHSFIFNVTWDAIEEQFKAGQFRDIKRDMPYYQARFHKILSDRLIELGYRIRRTKTAFEIVGVPQRVIDLFSKRTDEIGRIAKELGITDQAELDALGARTRSRKQKGLSMSELKQAWRQQIFALGMNDTGEGAQAIRFGALPSSPLLTPNQCLDHALSFRFERASVAPERRILETAYRHGIGNASVNVDQITDSFKRDRRILTVQEGAQALCTTKDVLREERQMVKLARQGQGTLRPLYAVAPPIALEGEQGEAVHHVLTTPNRVSIIRGRAGTGKTTLMREAVRLIEQAGCPVTVVAPTAQTARDVLRAEGFQEAETVAKLLASPDLQTKLANGVLWVDEAGLLNNADMTVLLKLAKENNARLILSGDTRQHASVVRGDALRILSTVAGIRSAEVSRIFRQRDPAYCLAVQSLSEGDAKTGFSVLDQMGAIKEVDPAKPFAELAEDYVSALQQGKTALVVSPTHQTGEQVTQAIRERLRQAGRIGKTEHEVRKLVNTNLTLAEKSDLRNYQAGQLIQFNQHASGFPRGSRWSVVAVMDNQIHITDGNGAVVPLRLSSNPPFDVFQPTTLGLSQGDSIRITRNGFDAGKKRVNNGQVLEVQRVTEDGTVHLRNRVSKARYTLPAGFGHLTHAHCLTSHAVQGKTVDAVFIAQPAASFAATHLNQFYVSVSRARDRVHIYTDDKEGLLAQASLSGERLSALELVKRQKARTQATHHLIRNPASSTATPKAKPQPAAPITQRKPVVHAPRP